jgi:hypothetical protein
VGRPPGQRGRYSPCLWWTDPARALALETRTHKSTGVSSWSVTSRGAGLKMNGRTERKSVAVNRSDELLDQPDQTLAPLLGFPIERAHPVPWSS